MLSRVIERSGAVPVRCAVTAERPETQSPKLVVSTPVGSFGEDSVFEHISPSPSGAPGESSLGGADSALHQEALFEVEAEADGEQRQDAVTNGAAALQYGHLRAPAGTAHAAPKPFNMAFGGRCLVSPRQLCAQHALTRARGAACPSMPGPELHGARGIAAAAAARRMRRAQPRARSSVGLEAGRGRQGANGARRRCAAHWLHQLVAQGDDVQDGRAGRRGGSEGEGGGRVGGSAGGGSRPEAHRGAAAAAASTAQHRGAKSRHAQLPGTATDVRDGRRDRRRAEQHLSGADRAADNCRHADFGQPGNWCLLPKVYHRGHTTGIPAPA
eukprot:357839-Chlamydomonas_euryale.AAC.10